ncbi:hypothetical protein [Micromonospora sp. NPDC051006]|uniref:hypothetical protein n=1 Tax=Micromonospora sp. NPDC051006 TaxID=3364283 RepID=UPI00378EC6EE
MRAELVRLIATGATAGSFLVGAAGAAQAQPVEPSALGTIDVSPGYVPTAAVGSIQDCDLNLGGGPFPDEDVWVFDLLRMSTAGQFVTVTGTWSGPNEGTVTRTMPADGGAIVNDQGSSKAWIRLPAGWTLTDASAVITGEAAVSMHIRTCAASTQPTTAPSPVAPSAEAPAPVVPTAVPSPVVPSAEASSPVVPLPVDPAVEIPSSAVPSPEAPAPVVPTAVPSPVVPSAVAPSPVVPSAEAPSTAVPSPVVPSAEAPSTAVPSPVVPSAEAPSAAVPSPVAPSTAVPLPVDPAAGVPTTVEPSAEATSTTSPSVAPSESKLPLTGMSAGSLIPMGIVGLGTVALGAALIAVRRRRDAEV